MVKVTVALLTYNRSRYLNKAIEAILNQSYKEFEFLICDNGSTDETPKIISSYKDERIKYIRNPKNEREFYNYPFFNSSGEYLLITHDDDIMHSNFLEREVEVLNRNPTFVAVGCNINYIDENDKVIKEKVFELDCPYVYKQYSYIKSYLKYIHLPCPTVLMRKQFFLRNHLKFDFSVGPGADMFLWYKVSNFPVELCLLNDTLYSYRLHSNQDSSTNDQELHIKLFESLLYSIRNFGLYDEERKSLITRLFNYYFKKVNNGKPITYRGINNIIGNIVSPNRFLLLKFYLKHKLFLKFPVISTKLFLNFTKV